MGYTLNEKQLSQLSEDKATDHIGTGLIAFAIQSSGVDLARRFHEAVGLPVGDDWSEIPTVEHRLLRGKLLIEEVLETLKAMGLGLSGEPHPQTGLLGNVEVVHVEGSKYDPIETADGLADIKVVANGTAVAFGIPQRIVDVEVFASNMTKLDENGNPIVNRCRYWESDEVPDRPMTDAEINAEMTRAYCAFQMRGEAECRDPSHLVDPTQPVGKVLKPSTYKKANIARLYVQHTKGE